MNIVFYSAVRERELFSRVGFYRDDIGALRLRGDDVCATNTIFDVYKKKPDMVVCYFYSKSLFAGLVGRFFGAHVVFTGGADQICPSLVSGAALRLRKLVAFLCLVVSHRIMLACADDYANFKSLALKIPFLIKKIKLVPHVVIPSQFERPSEKKNGAGTFDAFTLAWMGAVDNVRRKGVHRAVRLISLLRRQGIDARLAIAGTGGPGRDYLESLVSELGLTEYVRFLGVVSEDEKNRIFATTDVYLQLSEHEGFGVAAAEAFFSGMVVVHSNVGGLRDVIGNKGIVIDLDVIDNGDEDSVANLYNRCQSYSVDGEYLVAELHKYSLVRRSNEFFQKDHV